MNYSRCVSYNGHELTYSEEKSQGMITPIYRDIDGQLYMPIEERFVSVTDVIDTIAAHLRSIQTSAI